MPYYGELDTGNTGVRGCRLNPRAAAKPADHAGQGQHLLARRRRSEGDHQIGQAVRRVGRLAGLHSCVVACTQLKSAGLSGSFCSYIVNTIISCLLSVAVLLGGATGSPSRHTLCPRGSRYPLW